MLPSPMKLIMIPVTSFNCPKLPLKFLFRLMRLEVELNPKQLNCADMLISWQPAHTFKSVLLNHERTGQWSQIDMGKL